MGRNALVLSLLSAVIMCSCGDNSQFRVAGEIKGMGTQNIRAYYYTDGSLKWGNTTVIDGKFSFVGNASSPTIVEIYSSDKTLLCMLMARNGETIECRIENGNRYNAEFKGDEVSQQWGQFLTENSEVLRNGDNISRNGLIADYVAKNPDKMLSTVLLLTEFYTPDNELLADSLLNMIALEARPRHLVDGYAAMLSHLVSETTLGKVRPMNLYEKGDSLMLYNPAKSSYSILCFTSCDEASRDSILPPLKKWHNAYGEDRLRVVDVSFAPDTVSWKRSIKNDSVLWSQCWVLGSVQAKAIERLAIPRTPFFVVVDSTGQQLYRGSSITNATNRLTVELAD